jgi:hypothetical protein
MWLQKCRDVAAEMLAADANKYKHPVTRGTYIQKQNSGIAEMRRCSTAEMQ